MRRLRFAWIRFRRDLRKTRTTRLFLGRLFRYSVSQKIR